MSSVTEIIAALPHDQLAAALTAIAARLLEEQPAAAPVLVTLPADTAEMLTVAQVAARLNCSTKTIYRMKGLPFARKIGGSLRFESVAFEKWLAKQKA